MNEVGPLHYFRHSGASQNDDLWFALYVFSVTLGNPYYSTERTSPPSTRMVVPVM